MARDFHVKTDAYPLVSPNDEVVIVHANQLAPIATLYVGAHKDCIVEMRSAANRTDVETATGPHVGDPSTGGTGIFIPAGGKVRIDLPGSGFGALDLVSKLSPLKGQIFLMIVSFGEFDAYFKQIDAASIFGSP